MLSRIFARFAFAAVLATSAVFAAPRCVVDTPTTDTDAAAEVESNSALGSVDSLSDLGGSTAHNPSIIEVDGTYYMIGLQWGNPWHMDMYSSTDLHQWTFVDTVFDAKSSPDAAGLHPLRPHLIYNAQTKKYVLWFRGHTDDVIEDSLVAVAQCDTVDGQYEFVQAFKPLGYRSADETVFVDDDGVAYLVGCGSDLPRMSLTNIYQLTPDYLNVTGDEPVASFNDHREGPALFKRNGIYFLLTSGRTGWKGNQQKYRTAESIAGPWSDIQDVGAPDGFGAQTSWVQPVVGVDTSYLWVADAWKMGAKSINWKGSQFKLLPIDFPTDDSMHMEDYDKVQIDTTAGTVIGLD